ncbi:MAG: UDP-N-acetylmuramate dehydrogenase [Candidatus Pedobacter colombiensis]|uniref:UDP-N-acetylenolpyruvoylglucosamine reductase n=1 Tax=Candidatus Pedobacter colombiensis TaxID=3121371 RepID=A0AAJ5W864_9SPHI|nr:UDP-N-acetylmuramate dehydrogenase [Pedobacter sp.]WEK18794.1 MAG: UDP-N-acetylmuramate dehydrogenase [Pedobacter sp.]
MSIIQENISLQSYNTFGVAVSSSFFAEIFNESELKELLALDMIKKQPLLVLGGGSNILFTKDFNGLVIKVSIPGITAVVEHNEVLVTAGAGVVWNEFVNYCVSSGFAGVENLSLIPGTVGASPIQNIGAYGVELKDVFYTCRGYEIATGEERVFNFEDCKFGYRDSVFKNELKGQYIITAVTFKLSTEAHINSKYGAIQTELLNRNITNPTIADISRVVADIRVSKLPDPSTIGNAGSFFKNPVIDRLAFEKMLAKFPDVVHYPAPNDKIKLAAGWLIEQCGFKGKVVGHTGTWKNQALVLVNHGGATGDEVYTFSEEIINKVNIMFGVMLEREVNIL